MPFPLSLTFLRSLPLLFIPFIYAQTVHNVTAGVLGSFFDPETVAAGVNDTINFIFAGSIHAITQSTFDDPCTPLRGGFSSPLLGRNNILEDPAQMFTIVVTDVSQPIWFFCSGFRPASHCNGGMVGAINPPSQAMFQAFKSSAILVRGTPAFTPSLVTQGRGVIAEAPVTIFASIPPNMIPTSISTSESLPPTTENTIDVGPASTESASSTSQSNGAVIGGAIGGAIGGLLLIILSLVLCYRFKARQRRRSESGIFTYNPQHHTNPNPQIPGTATGTITSKASSPNYQITSFDSSNIQPLNPQGQSVHQSVQMIQRHQNQQMRTVLSDSTLRSIPSTTTTSGGQLNPNSISILEPQRYGIGGNVVVVGGGGDDIGSNGNGSHQTQTHSHTHAQSQSGSHAQTHINNPNQLSPFIGNRQESVSASRSGTLGTFSPSPPHPHLYPHSGNSIITTSSSPGLEKSDVDIKALAKEVAAILRPLHEEPEPRDHNQMQENHHGVKVVEMNAISPPFNGNDGVIGGLYTSSSPAPPPRYPSTGNNSFT